METIIDMMEDRKIDPLKVAAACKGIARDPYTRVCLAIGKVIAEGIDPLDYREFTYEDFRGTKHLQKDWELIALKIDWPDFPHLDIDECFAVMNWDNDRMLSRLERDETAPFPSMSL